MSRHAATAPQHPARPAAWLWLCLLLWLPAAWAQNDFGVVDLVEGQVSVLGADGRSYRPAVGDVLREGDLLSTGGDGELHVTTVDQGLVALRPNTRLRIEAYRAERDADDRSLLMLLQGRFRAVTGWIGRSQPGSYRVRTVTATIGVRGTDHEPAYIPENSAEGNPGTYDKVNQGETYIENERGQVSVSSGQSGFAALRAATPVLLAVVPEFYRPTRYEDLILQRRRQLEEQLSEPLRIKEEVQRAKENPREEAERRAREKIPGSEWIPRW